MRITRWLMTAILGLLLAAGDVRAQQDYPTRPIRLIVPFAAGGQVDIIARMLAPRLTETFKQSVIVDNRPGGGGAVGIETAVKANPDGYTMVLLSGAYAANAAFYKLPYDPVNDVAPIALISEFGYIVTLHPSVPVRSIKELVAYARTNPGKLNYGTGGTGGIIHLHTEFFNQMAGIRMTHVPYKGVAPALNELLGGQIQLVFAPMAAVIPHVRSNRVRGLAVSTARRHDAVPEIPTVAETLPGYEAMSWSAILGPRALPQNIVARWNTDINRILQLHEVKERMAGDGMQPTGGPPERFREVLKRDVAKWQKVVKTAGIKVE